MKIVKTFAKIKNYDKNFNSYDYEILRFFALTNGYSIRNEKINSALNSCCDNNVVVKRYKSLLNYILINGVYDINKLKSYMNLSEETIVKYIKDKYKLLVGDRTAEDIKVTIGTVFPGSRNEKMEVRGRDLVTGLPHSVTITSDEVEEALRESIYTIIH